MRVGVISPNAVLKLVDTQPACDDPDQPWPFDSLAKRASLLFDKLYLTENLDLTCEIVNGCDPDDPRCQTLRYLVDRGVLLVPKDLGYASATDLLAAGLKNSAKCLHVTLLKVGNPSNNCLPGENTYVGQPDIGDFEAHDGMHPRSENGRNDPRIKVLEERYETLLVQRNSTLLRQIGVTDVAIIGRVHRASGPRRDRHPVWEVVIHEMPDFDVRAPWEDVLSFRAEDRTQHLVRALRRWIRKIVSEEWTRGELEDEIRELVYEYEAHLRVAGLIGGKGMLTCAITGVAEVTESLVKLRLTRLAEFISAVLDRRARIQNTELTAPGHELALLSELKNPI